MQLIRLFKRLVEARALENEFEKLWKERENKIAELDKLISSQKWQQYQVACRNLQQCGEQFREFLCDAAKHADGSNDRDRLAHIIKCEQWKQVLPEKRKKYEKNRLLDRFYSLFEHQNITGIDTLIQEQLWKDLVADTDPDVRAAAEQLDAYLAQKAREFCDSNNFDGLADLMKRPSWKGGQGQQRRDFEAMFAKELHARLEGLEKKHAYEEVVRLHNQFKDCIPDGMQRKAIEVLVARCNQTREHDNQEITALKEKLAVLLERRCITQAKRVAESLECRRDENTGTVIDPWIRKYKEAERIFSDACEEVRHALHVNDVERARECLGALETEYPEEEAVKRLRYEFVGALVAKILKPHEKKLRQPELRDEEVRNIAVSIENDIRRYGTDLSLHEIINRSLPDDCESLRHLFQKRCDLLCSDLTEHILDLNKDAFENALSVIEIYKHECFDTDQMQDFEDQLQYLKAYDAAKEAHDHQKCLNVLERLLKIPLGRRNLPQNCALMNEYNSLKNKLDSWNRTLNTSVTSEQEQREIEETLRQIIDSDQGSYRERARKRLDEVSLLRAYGEAEQRWKSIAAKLNMEIRELEINLYRLDEIDLLTLSKITAPVKEYRDACRWHELVVKEIALRGRLQNMWAYDSATVTGCIAALERVREALKENPAYPPFKKLAEKIQEQLINHLLKQYKSFVEEKKLHEAHRVRELWRTHVPESDMNTEVCSRFGQAYAVDMVDERLQEVHDKCRIAQSCFAAFEVEKACEYAHAALELCVDDKETTTLLEKAQAFQEGIECLRRVEQLIEQYDNGRYEVLAEAPLKVEQAMQCSSMYPGLKKFGLRYDSVEEYRREIEKRQGITTNKLRISLTPGGRYLLFFGKTMRFGRLGDEQADIQLQTSGMKRNHCSIVNKNGSFYLKKDQGQCCISGVPLERERQLKENDILLLGTFFEARVATAAGGNLFLQIQRGQLRDPSIDGIIFMTDLLRIGPADHDHLRIKEMNASVQILYRNKAFFLLNKNNVETRITLGEPIECNHTLLALLRI